MSGEAQTRFDKLVSAAQGQLDTGEGSDIQGVVLLLRQAGVSQEKIAELQSNPSMIALIKANPDLVARLAQMFPSDHSVDYQTARTAAGLGDVIPTEQFTSSGGPDAMAHNIAASGPMMPSDNGATEFPGGVFVYNGQVFMPANNPSLLGSPAWMAQIPHWDENKRLDWAKTLKHAGYLDKVNVDLKTFTEAMAEYHNNRYLYGGGKPVDLTVGGGSGVSKKDFGGILDPAVLDTEVRSYHAEIYGADDDPSPEELKRGREFLARTALKLARKKGLDPSDAASIASARAQEKFRTDPATKKWQDLEETSTGLHDSFVNLFQVLSS